MKPILFNTEMVKAILEGRKTQTRRVVNKEYLGLADINGNNIYIEDEDGKHFNILETTWAKYKVGDILYVRETFLIGYIESGYDEPHENEYCIINDDSFDGEVIYKADHIQNTKINNLDAEDKEERPIWSPSIHMPKKYARIFLKVTNVRVEKLQDITFNEIRREGIFPLGDITEDSNNYISHIQELWINLWNSTAKNGYRWEDNPYVFVYEFERIEKPNDTTT